MSDSAGTVSVALCTFNGERFIREQLGSIGFQSHLPNEVIICDDGSTDRTIDIINKFASSSNLNIRLHQNPSRLGVTKNFERAISLCTGSVIFLCDQDDIWRHDKVEKLTAALSDKKVALAFSDANVVNEDLSPARYRLWESIWFDAKERERVSRGDALPVLLRHAIAAGSTLAFRASYLPLLLPIPDFPHSHDIWITLLLGAVARIAVVDEPLIQYRLHGANQVGMKKYGLLGQFKMARKQVADGAFRYAADFHEAARQRLMSGSISNLELLAEKVEHSRRRDQLPGWPMRLPIIGREWNGGNYTKYSYGFKSVLQDLFLR